MGHFTFYIDLPIFHEGWPCRGKMTHGRFEHDDSFTFCVNEGGNLNWMLVIIRMAMYSAAVLFIVQIGLDQVEGISWLRLKSISASS
jgi:hypothetical protein